MLTPPPTQRPISIPWSVQYGEHTEFLPYPSSVYQLPTYYVRSANDPGSLTIRLDAVLHAHTSGQTCIRSVLCLNNWHKQFQPPKSRMLIVILHTILTHSTMIYAAKAWRIVSQHVSWLTDEGFPESSLPCPAQPNPHLYPVILPILIRVFKLPSGLFNIFR